MMPNSPQRTEAGFLLPGDVQRERFKCTAHYEPCDGHELELLQGVDVEEDAHTDWIWMTFWYMGCHKCEPRCSSHTRFRDRIHNAIRILRGKPVFAEEFVFEAGEARRLASTLFTFTNKRSDASGKEGEMSRENG